MNVVLLWDNTRVGRRHAFCHVPDRLTSRVCVFADLLDGPALLKETHAAHTPSLGLAFKPCQPVATRVKLRGTPLLPQHAALVHLVLGIVHTLL